MFYQYWCNCEKWHGQLIFSGNFPSLSEADKVFEKQFNIKPEKNSNISVQIIKNPLGKVHLFSEEINCL